MTTTIQTDRLLLKHPTESDIANIVKYAGDKIIADGTINIPHPYHDQDARNWLELIKTNAASGEQVNFGLYLQNEGLIGSVGLKIAPRFNHAEVGYWIGVPFHGKGYATEALNAILDYGFDTLNLHKIFGNHFTSNPASAHVMIKCGMKKEAELIDHYMKGTKYYSIVQYCIFRNSTDS